MYLGALIVAGGRSKRFTSKIPKQFNIVNEGEPKSAEQQGQPKFDADKIVIDVVMRDLQSNGPIRNALRSG